MGVVYEARQAGLNRTVALKMVLAGPYAAPSIRARFLIEAESVAALEHPGIVRVFTFGESGAHPYLAMEYLPGGTLAERVRRAGPLPAKDATGLVAKLAGAVAHAHSRGVVHRDIKPGNVLLTADGEPRLTDFGLAKVGRADADLTATGQILGTPAYMAPEQAAGRGHEVGTAADVYALGALLYDVLTGRPPFVGDSVAATLRKVLTEQPERPRKLNAAIPPDLETICLKCLEKEPAKRYPTAQSLSDELVRFAEGRPITARRIGPLGRATRWARRNPVVAGLTLTLSLGLVLLAAGAVAGTVYYRNQVELEKELRHDAEVARGRATAAAADATTAKGVADARERERRRQFVRLLVGRGAQFAGDDLTGCLPWYAEALRAAGDEWDEAAHRVRLGTALRRCPALVRVWSHEGVIRSAEFSRDGRYVVTAGADGTVRVGDVRRTGSPSLALRHDAAVSYATFSPDGTRVAAAGEDGTASVWDAATGSPVAQPLRHPQAVAHVAFSPDGRTLAAAGADSNARLWDVATGGPAGGGPLPCRGPVRLVAFSPDGSRLAAAARAGIRVFDVKTGRVVVDSMTFEPDPNPPDGCSDPAAREAYASLQVPDLSDVYQLSFTADGKRVLACGDRARVWDAETGKPLGPPLGTGAVNAFAALSADGTRAVLTRAELAVAVDVSAGRAVNEVRGHRKSVRHVAFGPDGALFATASADGTARVWEFTGDQAVPLVAHAGEVTRVAFGPDGRHLLTVGADRSVRLWSLGRERPAQEPWPESQPVAGWKRFGPNGSNFAAGIGPHFDPLAGLIPAPPGRPRLTFPAPKTVHVLDDETGRPVCEPLEHEMTVQSAAVSRDGRYVLTSTGEWSPWVERTGKETGEAVVWGLRSGRRLATVRHGGAVLDAEFSADGERVATASSDGTARVWDALTGRPVTAALRHALPVTRVVFSPDGRFVATASCRQDRLQTDGGRDEGEARVWDVARGEPVGPPLQHPRPVNDVAFSPDGRQVATASSDGTARVWEVATGSPLTPPLFHARHLHVKRVAFVPGGRTLVTLGDKKRWTWDLSPDPRSAEELKGLAELLSGRRIDNGGGFLPVGAEEYQALWESRPDR